MRYILCTNQGTLIRTLFGPLEKVKSNTFFSLKEVLFIKPDLNLLSFQFAQSLKLMSIGHCLNAELSELCLAWDDPVNHLLNRSLINGVYLPGIIY